MRRLRAKSRRNERSPSKRSWRGTRLTVDVVIEYRSGIVLIERKNPPPGWALPGGFVDYGESVEQAARREAREETSLTLSDLKQFHVYSKPDRDPRGHTASVVFTARGRGRIQASSDTGRARVYTSRTLPKRIAFDHRRILGDYFAKKYDP